MRRRYSSSGDVPMTHFNTWGEVLDFATRPGKHKSDSARTNPNSFAGGSFASAIEMANNGWPEGEARMLALAKIHVDKLSSMIEREHPVMDIQGISIDMAAYLNGEPECWMRFDTQIEESPNNIVRLFVDMCVSAGVDKKIIEARGAVITALVFLLEQAGKRVEISTGFASEVRGFTWTLKPADQHIDMSRICYVLAHPTMFRRLGFNMWEQYPEDRTIGYNNPVRPVEFDADIVIPPAIYGESQWTDEAMTKLWLMDKLKEQGVKLT